MKQVNEITEKIAKNKGIGFKKDEIRQIVTETYQEIKSKENRELAKSVAGTD